MDGDLRKFPSSNLMSRPRDSAPPTPFVNAARDDDGSGEHRRRLSVAGAAMPPRRDGEAGRHRYIPDARFRGWGMQP